MEANSWLQAARILKCHVYLEQQIQKSNKTGQKLPAIEKYSLLLTN